MGMLTVDPTLNYPSISRHHSFEPRRKIRRRKLERDSWAAHAFDYDDEDDIFGTSRSNSHSPSPQPMYSLRASPQPPNTDSSCSTASMINECCPNDVNFNDARNLFVNRYCTEPPPMVDYHMRYPHGQQIRSFHTDKRGRLIDCGFTSAHQSRPLTRSNKNRRATCPEIWLSSAEDGCRSVTRCTLRVYGTANTGKKTLANQMAAHADITAYADLNLDYEELNLPATNTVGFMMNDDEVQLEIVQGATTPETDDYMTMYMIVYSVDNRDSFVKAAQIMYRLHDCKRLVPGTPVVLVGNKVDLQRKRKVAYVEGKMLGKIYKSAFVEASGLLSMNMDILWEETLKKFQKHKAKRDMELRNLKNAVAPKHSPNCLMGRIVKQGRRFAKSCEEIVAKLAAL